MRTLIVSDIHGNLPALEAVLSTTEAQSCDDIVSLGDHVSFCAQSRAVHERLVGLGAVMLLGNHEERLTRPSDAEFDAYNWAPMRWTARQMAGIALPLPTDLRRGEVLFTHGTPGEPYHLVQPTELPEVLYSLPDGVTLLLSGHNHVRWNVQEGARRAFNPGSAGLPEDAAVHPLPSAWHNAAPFAVLETLPGQPPAVTACEAHYDARETLRAFISSGMCKAAPEICRAVAHVLLTREYQGVVKLMRHVSAIAQHSGLDFGDEAAWKLADRSYPWTEAMTSEEYWTYMEGQL